MKVEQAINAIRMMPIPEVDVHDRVMERITVHPRSVKWSGRLIIAFTAILIVIGTGFTTWTMIRLFDANGNEVFSVKDSQDSEPVLTEDEQRHYLSLLHPGEAMAVYDPSNNPERIITVIFKPLEIYGWETLRQQADPMFSLPAVIPDPFVFQRGYLEHVPKSPDQDRISQASEANGGSVIFEKVKITEEIHGVTMHFMADGQAYTASLYKGDRWERVYRDLQNMEQTETVTVAGVEGLFTVSEGQAVLMWRSGSAPEAVFHYLTTDEVSLHRQDRLVSLLRGFITAK